jgi:flagellar basal-body rod protein FlgF
MIRGLWAAHAGMLSELERSDLMAQDLANQSIPGYRRNMPGFETVFESMLSAWTGGRSEPTGVLGLGARLSGPNLGLDLGAIQDTGKSTNVALESPGFFVVQTAGGTRYTRNGDWRVAGDGRLVTSGGHQVVGTDGAVRVSGSGFVVSRTGEVVSEGKVVGRLAVVDFADGRSLIHDADGLYMRVATAPEPTAVSEPSLRQGALELSNVNPVSVMTSMMTAMRVYEANQKVVTALDEILNKAVNEVGRV